MSRKRRREDMQVQVGLKSVQWMLAAVLALAPTAVLAGQDNVPAEQDDVVPVEQDDVVVADGTSQGSQDGDPLAEAQPLTEGAETDSGDAGTDSEDAGTDGEGAEAQGEDAETKGEDAQSEDEETQSDGPQVISGMSILGNQEAPTSLVIVPWKSSEIGDSIGVSTILDDSRQPVDREVFMRELRYYEIRSETRP